MNKIVSRSYNSLKIDGQTIIKSSNTERLKDERNYYYEIINHPLSIYFPRLIDDWKIDDTYYLKLEYYTYKDLGKYLLNNSHQDWYQICGKIKNILEEFGEYTNPKLECYNDQMLLQKTNIEYNKFKESRPDLKELFESKYIWINEKEYLNFESIWPYVSSYIQNNLLEYIPTIGLGDLTLSNILYSVNEDTQIFKFIDMRGKFSLTGESSIYLDQRYEIAKLSHSINNKYEALINGLFNVTKEDNKYELIISPEITEYYFAQAAFDTIFYSQSNKFNKKDIMIIEGCIWAGMIHRHSEDKNRQVAQYLTCIKVLNEALEL